MAILLGVLTTMMKVMIEIGQAITYQRGAELHVQSAWHHIHFIEEEIEKHWKFYKSSS
jgi:hypothetical protein